MRLLVLWSWFLVGLGICSGQVICVCCFEFWHFVGVLGFFGVFSDCFWVRVCVFFGLLVFLPIALLVCRFGFVFVGKKWLQKRLLQPPGLAKVVEK